MSWIFNVSHNIRNEIDIICLFLSQGRHHFGTVSFFLKEGIILDDPRSARCLLFLIIMHHTTTKKVNAASQWDGSSMSAILVNLKLISSVSPSQRAFWYKASYVENRWRPEWNISFPFSFANFSSRQSVKVLMNTNWLICWLHLTIS